jgi:ribosomal protein L6P/L9E
MFFQQFSTYRHIKIKFAGKGYKIKKNTQNSLVFLFNRAHITNIWWRNTITKKLKKYKIYMQGTANVLKLALKIISIRPINIFTKRGLRISRQIVLKKKGKK